MRTVHSCTFCAGLFALFLVVACDGGEGASGSGDGAVKDFENAAKAGDQDTAKAALQRINKSGKEKVDPATLPNPLRLKAFLPESAAGFPRRSVDTDNYESKSRVITAGVSARYYPDGGNTIESLTKGPSVDISVQDAGSMSGMLSTLKRDVDFNQDGVTAKSVTLSGFKAREETEAAKGTAGIQLLLTDRVMVVVEGKGVTLDALRETIRAMDLKTLVAQIENGAIRELTDEQKTKIVDKDALKALLPAKVLEEEAARTNAYAIEGKRVDRPRAIADAFYGQRGNYSIHVESYKSAQHAREEKPSSAENVKRTLATVLGEKTEPQAIKWGDHDGWMAFKEGRGAVVRLYAEHVIIEIKTPDEAKAKAAFEALDVAKLVALKGEKTS